MLNVLCMAAVLLTPPAGAAAPVSLDDPARLLARGEALIEKNCGDCADGNREGLASGIGLVEEALPQLEAPDEVIRAHSALAAGYRTLAYVFARPDSAEQERAEETLRGHHKKLVELRPSDASALFEYAELLDDRGAAAVLWRKAIEMDPMFLPARLSLGMHLVESGAAEEGLAELRFAFEKAEGADVRRYALRLADALYQLGRHAEAEELRVAFKR